MVTNNTNRILDKLKIAAQHHVKEKEYWLKKLSGDLVKNSFPYDDERTGEIEGNVEVIKFKLTGELFSGLIKLSRKSDIRLHIILVTGLITLLHFYSESNDIIVGMPIYKQDIDGEYINKVLALRNQFNDNVTFRELLNEVRQTIVEAVENQDYPIEILPEDLNIPSPGNDFLLFDMVILLENIHDKRYIQHIHPNIVFSFKRLDQYIEGVLEYNSLLYREASVKRIIAHLKNLLQDTIPDLDLRLGGIEILSLEEKKQLVDNFNDTNVKFPKDHTIDELFEKQAKRTPGHTAVIFDAPDIPLRKSFTYKELNEKANQLAGILREKGVKPGTIAAVLLGHSIEMIVAILAVLKAGGGYLPIDPAYPEARINYMLRDSRPKALVTGSSLANEDDKLRRLEVKDDLRVVYVDSSQLADSPSSQILKFSTSRPQSLAYVIYTSGTTGRPKGVMVEHRNVVRLVKNSNLIDFSGDAKLLLTGAIVFDIITFEIWGPILNGATLFLVDQNVILDGERLGKTLRENEISILHLTPQLFNQLADQHLEIFAGLDYFLVGGDLVRPHYVNKVRNRYKDLKILHMYGPTENTTFSTFFPVNKDYETTIPIGKPFSNSTVYIVDKYHKLKPLGLVGELNVAGEGIARGYLNKPQLTMEKFSDNPFVPGGKMYGTGDLARWLMDGNIEFLGRMDNQVKIRGFRVELGEIENQLVNHNKVKEVAVTLRERAGQDKYLCAYIVAEMEQETGIATELRDFLSKRLPPYMIPAYFISIDKIPLTPNGKSDRNALPEPEVKKEADYSPPRDEIEKKLAKMWANLLGIAKDSIGIDSNFFNLGGHSLTATILLARVHKEFSLRLLLVDIFAFPTLKEFGKILKTEIKKKFVSIEPVEKQEYYPLSSAQKRIYFLQAMDVASTAYNMAEIFELVGKVEEEKLKEAFNKLIKRHKSLRTSFSKVEGEPIQKIHDEVEFEIEYYEGNTNPGAAGGMAARKMKDFIRPFDLTRAPLLRVGMIKLEETKHLMMVDMHHTVNDGMSHALLVTDFSVFYNGKELPSLRIQYKDFSQWQNKQKQEIKKQENYWVKKFSGNIPLLKLPTDYPRPEFLEFEGGSVQFALSKNETIALAQMARDEDVTLFMILLALYNILLSKITNQADIVVGTGAAGRLHVDLEPLVGMFVNTLALRNFPRGEKFFDEFLQEIKKRTLEDFDNQLYQFADLVAMVAKNRSADRNPIFDVLIALQNFEIFRKVNESENIDTSLKVNHYGMEKRTTKYDLILIGYEDNRLLKFSLEYRSKLFKVETKKRFISNIKRIVSTVIENRRIK